MKPFSEAANFDSPTDSFFMTGTLNVGEVPGSFAGPLRNKEQIRLSFNVKNPVMMLPNTSSIYYYNVQKNQWNIPTRSIDDHVDMFSRFSCNTIGAVGYGGLTVDDTTNGSILTEDAKGFDAYGRASASGSLHIFRQLNPNTTSNRSQTIEIVGRESSTETSIQYMTDDYVKSVQRASIYDASIDESFSTGIERPFLLEKAVVELPICVGSTWFGDKTVTTYAYATGTYGGTNPFDIGFYYDKGGPVLTLSLFCQKKFGVSSIRDLILSGTITNEDDTIGNVGSRQVLGVMLRYAYEFAGFSSPTSMIVPNDDLMFTGSVVMKMTPSVSNGIGRVFSVEYPIHGTDSTSYITPDRYAPLKDLFSTEFVDIKTFDLYNATKNFPISDIDPFGRGMTGFSPSGGSIFGKEYTTPSSAGDTVIRNPFYIADTAMRDAAILNLDSDMAAIIANSGGPPLPSAVIAGIIFVGNTPGFYTSKDSPYLINPGDRLVLAMSKTRPAIYASGHNIPNAAAALVGRSQKVEALPLHGDPSGHDVMLATGSINITLYGSYVREGSRYTP